MLAELRARLGQELERLSHQVTARTPIDPAFGVEMLGEDASAELQRIFERRIRFLGQLVAGLARVDPTLISPDRAGYGSVVEVRDLSSGVEESYTLMAGEFIDLEEGQVSLASPIGQALIGHRVGDQIGVVTPGGERRYEIVGLTTLPAKLGMVDAEQGEGEELVGASGALQVA